MMYIKVSTVLSPYLTEAADVLIALMGDAGFESFMETQNGFEAYMPSKDFKKSILESLELPFSGIEVAYQIEEIPEQNWNENWEKNYFNPIVVSGQCVVRSPFHKDYPDMPIQIIIEPKMSFGTGHHETTALMMEHILENNMKDKRVLDMGCGTGILGILTSIQGAKEVTGIDNDNWCTENSEENCQLNNIHNMQIILGDAGTLKNREPYDVILANINRNILLEDLRNYTGVLKHGATIIISGFYQQDLDDINKIAKKNQLQIKTIKENNHWVAVAYEKRL